MSLRKLENWSKVKNQNIFFNPKFDKEDFQKNLLIYSSKGLELMKNIKKIDKEDLEQHGKLFKHYIFSDEIKQGGLMLASLFTSFDYNLCYEKNNKLLQIKSDKELLETKSKNFAFLSSGPVTNTKTKVRNIFTKKILEKFNSRPDNINGNLIRFIILDKGFKEGIDLHDVKYVHIFETPMNNTDKKQVIGRATRNCGQIGLPFIKKEGWKLETFIYSSIYDDKKLFDMFIKSSSKNNSNEKIKLINIFENMAFTASVDHDLNIELHRTKKQELKGGEFVPKKSECRLTCGVANKPVPVDKIGFLESRELISKHYLEFKK